MKKLFYLIASFAVFSGCKNAPEVKVSPSGKYTYSIIEDVEGPAAKEGDVIILHLIGKDDKDSVWFDNNPMVIRKDSAKWLTGEQGLFEIFNDVSEGDSLVTTIDTKLFFEESVGMPVPPEADSVPSFTFNVKVTKVTDYEGYTAYMTEMMESKSREQNAFDEGLIKTYVEENSLVGTTTEEGIFVAITQAGEGDNIASGQTVTLNYTGYLTNKLVFDTSVQEVAEANGVYNPNRPYEPFSFTVDQDAIIQGWHIGFKELNKGSKATILIPSSLGYGQNGSGVIPPNSVLIFDIEVIDVQ